MATVEEQIEKIDTIIGLGAKRVKHREKDTEFMSADELLKVRSALTRRRNSSNRASVAVISFSRRD